MVSLKVNASRKTTIILLLVLFLIVGSTGGYLLWRVNQGETVAPSDSEAGGGGEAPGGPCTRCPGDPGTGPVCVCGYGVWCPQLPRCATKRSGAECTVPACVWPSVSWWLPDMGEGNCACAPRTTWDESPDLRCNDNMPSCTPPSCPTGYIDMHIPGGGTAFEPSNYSTEDLVLIEAAKLFDHKTRIVCVANGSAELCFTECGQERCQPCNNPYWVRRMCKKAPVNLCGNGQLDSGEQCDPGTPGASCANGQTCTQECTCPEIPVVNTCDAIGAKWKKVPSKTVTYGTAVPYEYVTADKDGVQNANIVVKLDGSKLTSGFTKSPSTANDPKITVTGSLPTSLSIGEHKLEISWSDIHGIDGGPCYAYALIKVVAQNPDWELRKESVELCIDDGTENPISEISNTITVKNTNTTLGAVGKMSKIVDVLDSKVDRATVTDITNGGVYESGEITWTFETGSDMANYQSNQSRTFSYKYKVSKGAFGIYDNTAVATTVANNTIEAGSTIEARCNVLNPSCGNGEVETSLGEQCDPPGGECTDIYGQLNTCSDTCTCPGTAPVPDTGLFDESENLAILGAILLFLGLGWTWLNKTYEIVNGELVQRNKQRFERKVVKN